MVTISFRAQKQVIQGRRWRPPVSPRENPGRLTPAGNAGCSACGAAGPVSGQKVVYGCMQGTGVIFRDLSPFLAVFYCAHFGSRLPGGSGRQARLRQAAAGAPASLRQPAGAVSGCRYGPMRENPACATVPVAPPLSRRDLRSLHTCGV